MLAVVSDASPLIYLAHLGRFDLLSHVFSVVIVPPAVWAEVAERGAGLEGSHLLRASVAAGWVVVEGPSGASLPDPALAELGAGEQQAIQLAWEKHATLIIDDAQGRLIAQQLGLKLSGTLGVLVEAKRRGLLAHVRPEVDRLLAETNFRVSTVIRDHILRLAGESNTTP
jgi:predicted nucleic acid-binding protein